MNPRTPGTSPIRSHRPFNFVLGLIAAAALLGLNAGAIHAGSAPAPQMPAHDLDALACAPAPVNWTDCTITLAQSIPAGGSVIAAVQGTGATVAYCSDGTAEASFCGAYGNEAVFYCPSGCTAGQTFDVSAVGASSTTLAQSLNVALGPTDPNWPGPGGLPEVNSYPGNDGIDVGCQPPVEAPTDSGGN